MRGRKPKQDSRVEEIRAKLAAWKQMPESSRPSLRALARDLGTSHQLLSHYLERWGKWQAEEYRRQAKEIRARAEAENRAMTELEAGQAWAWERVAFRATVDSALSKMLRRLKQRAKLGQLPHGHSKLLRVLARYGDPEARKILERLEKNLPPTPCRASKSFRRA